MNRRPSNGNGLLHMAAAGGSEQCCRMLWKRGFDINEQNSDGNTPLSCAVHTKQVGIDGEIYCVGLEQVGWLKCCFTSTETVSLLGTRAQDGHLHFHTAPEL